MEQIDRAVRFLRELGKEDLSALLVFSTYQYVEKKDKWLNYSSVAIELRSPKIYSEVLSGLLDWDKKRITVERAPAIFRSDGF